MASNLFGDADSEGCDGSGYLVGPICCGNLINGECRGYCAVPEQVQCDGCEHCQQANDADTGGDDAPR